MKIAELESLRKEYPKGARVELVKWMIFRHHLLEQKEQ